MAYEEKHGKGWRSRYLKPNGTYGSESGFKTKSAAHRYGEDQEAQIRAKTWIDPDEGKITLDQYWDEWIPAQKLSDSTLDRYTGYYFNHLSTRWGGTAIREITGLQVDAHKKAMRQDEKLAVSTVTAIIGLLRRMMDDAVFYRRIVSTPVRPTSRRGEKEPDEARKGQAVELETVLAIRARLPAPEALMVLVTVFTGLRWGEIAGMRRKYLFLAPADGDAPASGWYEIDEKLGALKERKGRLSFGPPKDREARVVELPAFLVVLLLAYLETIPAKREMLFPCGSGEGYRRGTFGRQLWRPACDGWKELLPGKRHPGHAAAPPIVLGLRFHDLRHTHETWMTEDHIPKIARDARLGHQTPGMEGTYNHTTAAMRAEILMVLERRWARQKSRAKS